MKKSVVVMMLLALVQFSFADSVCVVDGVWEREKPEKIFLYDVSEGSLREIASSKRGNDGKFNFAFTPEAEGLFVIGISNRAPANNYTFYFKPGDRLNVVIGEDDYQLVGKNTNENKEMARWHDYIRDIEFKSIYFSKAISTYVDFFPLLEEKLAGMNNYGQKYTKNKTFNEVFGKMREKDVQFYASYFLQTPRTAHPSEKDLPAYYHTLTLENIAANADLLSYPYGKILLSTVSSRAVYAEVQKLPQEQRRSAMQTSNRLAILLDKVRDPQLRGELIADAAQSMEKYDDIVDFQKKYDKYLVTDQQKERVKTKTVELSKLEATQRTFDFKFRDMDGKEVALSDFKGKVVYLDVWATWCGPCKAEIPHLKKVEQAYHGKDVIFLSVSVDAEKNLQVWKDFVVKEDLKGVQLFAGDKARNDILDPYQIKGIPRFILFGRDGKVLNANAPRPSNPDLTGVLDKALEK